MLWWPPVFCGAEEEYWLQSVLRLYSWPSSSLAEFSVHFVLPLNQLISQAYTRIQLACYWLALFNSSLSCFYSNPASGTDLFWSTADKRQQYIDHWPHNTSGLGRNKKITEATTNLNNICLTIKA